MAEERSLPSSIAAHPARIREATWLAPFLFTIAVAAEVLSFMLMSIYRYRNQLLPPDFFDLGKTANLLAFLFEAPFILLFLMLLTFRRFHTLSLSAMAVAMASIGLVALSAAPMFEAEQGAPSYMGYLIFIAIKALELGMFAVALRRPSKALWKNGLRVILFVFLLMLGMLTIVIATVLMSPFSSSISSSITDQPRQEYDAGVILGAAVWSGDRPSPVLRERINKGYDLLKNGNAQFLVLTGGEGAPNELPEAEVARRELLKQGVDPTRIVTETNTSSTLEQILFIRDQLQKKQGWHSFIIISDQFHLKRALEICDFNNIDAIGVSSESPLGPQNLAQYHLRESGALILYWLFGM